MNNFSCILHIRRKITNDCKYQKVPLTIFYEIPGGNKLDKIVLSRYARKFVWTSLLVCARLLTFLPIIHILAKS